MKPIHIMRWAPADYVNDPAVKLALAKRDYVASTFYPLFLFHAYIQGGHLTADPEALGAILGMKPADVCRALEFWTAQGKVREREGRLYHERVLRDIAAEMAFREEQAEKGKLGGRPRLAKAEPLPSGKPMVLDRQSPPLPLPAPTPAPERQTPDGPPSNPLAAGRRPQLEAECLTLVRMIADATGDDPVDVIAEASHYTGAPGARTKLNPASMTDDRLLNTLRDLRHTAAEIQRRKDHGIPIRA